MEETNDNYQELAAALVSLVGNRKNIADVTHCVTRLRFILRDEGLANTEAIENLPEVVAVVSSGGQYQVVIGTQVPDVFEAVMAELGSAEQGPASEVAVSEPAHGKPDLKGLLGKISGFLVNCMQPLIPMMASVGLIRTLAMVLGPNMLGLLSAESGTIRILTLVGQAGIASLPIFIAWSSSRYLKTNTVLALFYGAFLVYGDLEKLLKSGEAITLFGLPVPAASYSSQVVPVMLIMLAMYLVEKLLKRFLSKDAQFMVMPVLETIIMLPLMLCIIGPLGTLLGNLLAKGIMALYNVAGPLSVALIGSLFIFICATGMHTAIMATAFNLISTQGHDMVAMVGAGAASYGCFGLYLAYTLFVKDKRQKQIGLSAFLTHAVGGVAEPGMFSLLFTHARLMIIEMVAGFLGGFYLGLMNVGMYVPGISNFMAVLQFSGGDANNLPNAAIGCAISFVVGFSLTTIMLFRERRLSASQE
ncbi:MAG: PTS transporter subunit EIIC [Coriobacteriales bacterium]|nr:PTS transporter subunit EIIC [Coriobacteriales bacterium]